MSAPVWRAETDVAGYTDLVGQIDPPVNLATSDELDHQLEHFVLLHPERGAHPRQLDRLERGEVLDERLSADRCGQIR